VRSQPQLSVHLNDSPAGDEEGNQNRARLAHTVILSPVPRLWIVICCLAMIACDRNSPSPPVVDVPPTTETITGNERIGWDQPAADAVELAAIGYVVYVDGARTALAGVTCAEASAGTGFPCTARLPALTAGTHTLELASFVTDGGVLESARSGPLRVTMAALAQGAPAGDRARAVVRNAGATRDEIVADGLESPTDLAFAPDGRLFVAERAGRIRVIRPPSASARQASLIGEPAIALADTLGAGVQLLAIALDPAFQRTHHLFAIYAGPARAGAAAFTLARFRDVSDTLGDRAVLLDGVTAATPSASAALRFGPDGKLYAAFDDGGDARRRGDAGSLNGKVLRLNTDGTTPSDPGGATPIYTGGYGSPVAIDWDPPTATLWAADRAAGGSAFVFYRGALFPAWSGRLLSAATLFDDSSASGIGVVAVGPDGAIYYGTAGAIGRLTPARAP
jgi:glucose/arabinose dehydrogenase